MSHQSSIALIMGPIIYIHCRFCPVTRAEPLRADYLKPFFFIPLAFHHSDQKILSNILAKIEEMNLIKSIFKMVFVSFTSLLMIRTSLFVFLSFIRTADGVGNKIYQTSFSTFFRSHVR